MDDILNLAEELKNNGFAKNLNWRLCVVYGNTAQDGQYSAEARQAADRLAKYIPTYGQWTIEQILTQVKGTHS
jgi:hypothetical protein